MHTLAYADDLALTDNGDADGVVRANARVTQIAVMSTERVDLKQGKNKYQDQSPTRPTPRPSLGHNLQRGYQGMQICVSSS